MANEKRLIDVNKLKTKAIADPDSGEGIVYVQDIDEDPTVDAVEVVHGRWIIEYWKSGYIKRCYCSECGETPKDAYKPDNYCPNCGAKMDGGNEDDTSHL